jgi:hypothetical protein
MGVISRVEGRSGAMAGAVAPPVFGISERFH